MKTTIKTKINGIIFMSLFLCCNICSGQRDIINNDKTSRRKMGYIQTGLATQIGENTLMIEGIKLASTKLKDELEINYTVSPDYDYSSEFMIASTMLAAFKIARDGAIWLINRNGLGRPIPYFSRNKYVYLNTIADESDNLLFLQWADSDLMRNADRQQLYRLRREILAEYSAEEKKARSALVLPGVFYIVQNTAELSKELKTLEIIK